MDIFESLENLEISEECFDEIMDMVEEIIDETNKEKIQKTLDVRAYNAGRADGNQWHHGQKSNKNKEDKKKYDRLLDLIKKRVARKGEYLNSYDTSKYIKGFDDAETNYGY